METPVMASSTYASSNLNMNQLMQGVGLAGAHAGLGQQAQAAFDVLVAKQAAIANQVPVPVKAKEKPMADIRRLVQVFIADPNENVPLDSCLLYKGDLKLTNLTDQELFFEIDIKSVMDAHNAKRVAMVDKSVKERTEYLEPARIRDLKMTVVTVASF